MRIPLDQAKLLLPGITQCSHLQIVSASVALPSLFTLLLLLHRQQRSTQGFHKYSEAFTAWDEVPIRTTATELAATARCLREGKCTNSTVCVPVHMCQPLPCFPEGCSRELGLVHGKFAVFFVSLFWRSCLYRTPGVLLCECCAAVHARLKLAPRRSLGYMRKYDFVSSPSCVLERLNGPLSQESSCAVRYTLYVAQIAALR